VRKSIRINALFDGTLLTLQTIFAALVQFVGGISSKYFDFLFNFNHAHGVMESWKEVS
jgi:hypothetical protein